MTAVSPGYFRTDFLDGRSVRYTEGTISDCAEGVAAFRASMEDHNHAQAGDPAKLANVIVKLADIERPPVSFVAGTDAVVLAIDAINSQRAQIEAWRDLSVSTDGAWAQTLRHAG